MKTSSERRGRQQGRDLKGNLDRGASTTIASSDGSHYYGVVEKVEDPVEHISLQGAGSQQSY